MSFVFLLSLILWLYPHAHGMQPQDQEDPNKPVLSWSQVAAADPERPPQKPFNKLFPETESASGENPDGPPPNGLQGFPPLGQENIE